MKINKVKLQNFRSFEQAEFSLHPKLNVFAGVNASGKSTVLEAIEMLLGRLTREAGQYNANPEIQGNDVTEGKQPDDCRLGIDINAGFINEEFADNQGFVSYGIGVRKEGEYLSPVVDFSIELKKRIGENQELPVLLSFMLGKVWVGESESTRRKNPIYQNAWNCSVQNDKEFEIWFEREESIENEKRLNEDFNYRLPLLENVRKALEVFMGCVEEGDNPFSKIRTRRFSFTNYDGTPTYHSYLSLEKGGMQLDLSQLSSGEKSLIVLVSEIARRASMTNRKEDALACSGIVLIDEIDLHLHPRWQRNILPALCNTFPNIQFIVTSHSPQVLGSIPPKDGLILRLVAGQVVYEEGQLGKDTNYILETQMEASEIDAEAKADIDEYLEHILNADFSSQEDLSRVREFKAKIENKYGMEFSGFLRAEQMIRKKSKSIQSKNLAL